jgi:DNA-binding SARP family transcriptional activator/tetratricopeptide (TPR) repeat protein
MAPQWQSDGSGDGEIASMPPGGDVTRVQFRILGPMEVGFGDRGVPIDAARQRTVLATLLLEPNRVLPAERIIALVWGDDPPATAHKTLQTLVHRLRRRLETLGGDEPLLLTQPPGYLLRLSPSDLDLHRLQQLHQAGAQAMDGGDPQTAAQLLRRAELTSRGPALVDVPADGPLAGEIARLRELQLQVVEDRLEAELAVGRHSEVVAELGKLTAEHPTRERLCGQLMLTLYRCGRQAEALTVYRTMRRALAEELGIAPTPALEALHRRILEGDGSLALPALPRLRSAGTPAVHRPLHHLPIDVADFTGRERFVRELTERLAGEGRGPSGGVVVVTGRAGVGKTSLAVHVAHLLADAFPGGRLLVNLGGTADRAVPPAEALLRLLLLLGAERRTIARDAAQRTDQYRSLLAGRRVLLVLDNAVDEAQVRPLLPWDGESAVIVTSRRPLAALEAAHRLTLPELDAAEAVELLARVSGPHRVAAERDAAHRIAGLCDRLPLAIQIAGAKLVTKRHWTLSQMATRLASEQRRLDELQVGDLAVRASLRLSYDALQQPAQHLFQVLGQLSGEGFPAWVPATLVGMTVPEVVDILEELVDRQLVDPVGPDHAGRLRYRLHDLLALLARELLHDTVAAPQRQAAKGQALQAWLTILDGMETRLVAGDKASGAAHQPFTASYPMEWLPAQRSALAADVDDRANVILDTGWSLTGVLVAMSFELWSQWDHWRMTRTVALYAGRRVDDRLVAADHGGTLDRATLVPGSAVVKPGHEQPWAPVVASLERALATFRSLGEVNWHALTMLTLGNVYRAHARLDHAATTLHSCIALYRELGDRNLEAAALFSQGSLRVVEGDLRGAIASYEQCLTIFSDRRDVLWQAYTRRALGYAFQQHGRYAEAVAELAASLQVFRTHGDRMWEAHTLLTLGQARLGMGRHDAAAADLTACIRIFREYGDPRSEALALRGLARTTGGAAQEQHLLAALDGFLLLEDPVGGALTMYDLARLHSARGRPGAAERCLRVYREISAELGMVDLVG